MLRVQRVLANGEQTEGTIAYFEEPGSPRSYEVRHINYKSLPISLTDLFTRHRAEHSGGTENRVRSTSRAQRPPRRRRRTRFIPLGLVHPRPSGYDHHRQSSDWARDRLVRPGYSAFGADTEGADGRGLGRVHDRSAAGGARRTRCRRCVEGLWYSVSGRAPSADTPSAGQSAAPRRHSPLASQRDRNRQASSAPESPRLEPSVYPSPPTSRPRSLVGPSAATSALASLATSCPDLGQRHASVSPPTTRKQTASLTMTSRWGGEEERGDSTSPRSASALAESVKGVRRTSAGMPHLASHHFDDIGEWDGGVGTAVTSVMRPKEAPAASGAFSRGTKPKRPTLDTVAGPSSPRHSSSISPSQAMIKASSAPVTATEMQEESEIPRRIRTQADRERTFSL